MNAAQFSETVLRVVSKALDNEQDISRAGLASRVVTAKTKPNGDHHLRRSRVPSSLTPYKTAPSVLPAATPSKSAARYHLLARRANRVRVSPQQRPALPKIMLAKTMPAKGMMHYHTEAFGDCQSATEGIVVARSGELTTSCHAENDSNVITEELKFAPVEAQGWKVDGELVLGEGGFASVYACTHAATGTRRACKAVKLASAEDREDYHNEVAILRTVGKHKNICHVIDAAEDRCFGYIIMQSCTGGELFERIVERSFTEREAAMVAIDILGALNFLHSKHIIHRDVKPENLLFRDCKAGSSLCLVDFGFAIQIQPGKRITEACGTTSYMAPEVLRCNYSVPCDLWSLGVICYLLLSATLPFKGRNDDETEARILRGAISFPEAHGWDKVSNEAKAFVRRLLAPEERRRISGQDALQHPWIVNRGQTQGSQIEDP